MKYNEQTKNELIAYIKKNKRDYYTILKLYDCQNYKVFYYKFIDFYYYLKNDSDLNSDKVQKQIIELKDLFQKIKKSVCLNKHQEVCVLSIGVYLSLFINVKCSTETKEESQSEIKEEKSECSSKSDNDNSLDLFDNANFNKINEKLTIAHKQIAILINIVKQLQKEYAEKINIFSISRLNTNIENTSVDYINKITLIAYKQIESLVTKNNCIFNGKEDTCSIKIYSETGKSSTLCIIDNFKINLEEDNKKKYINIRVANINHKIYLMKDKIMYCDGIEILKNAMKSYKNILTSLESNKKMINYWLNISKNNDICKT